MNIALRCRHCALPLAAALILSVYARGEDASFGKKTYVYKTVGETKIEADVYRAADAMVRPALVWLHGGALIVGNREQVPRQLLDLARAAENYTHALHERRCQAA